MEPITTLAATVIAILTPYVAKGAEEFVKGAGKDAYEKTKQLFVRLKEKWTGDDEASQALTNFEKKPDWYEPVLRKFLERDLETDRNFADDISNKVNARSVLLRRKLQNAKATSV
ncbi:MAG: hypothetical protein ND866_27035 [Pyrinomonadaceae bacterium]|nr:hypothetical protein [Pyrinomonadaceae bacterium]